MNVCFYEAIARLPLGTVAAIEFVPVVVLAVARRAHRRATALALLLAVGGVALLTDVRLEGEPVGVAFAAANAVLFMLYIVLGHRVAAAGAGSGVDGLAASMLVAAVAVHAGRRPRGGAGPHGARAAARRDRRRHLLVGRALRRRPARAARGCRAPRTR